MAGSGVGVRAERRNQVVDDHAAVCDGSTRYRRQTRPSPFCLWQMPLFIAAITDAPRMELEEERQERSWAAQATCAMPLDHLPVEIQDFLKTTQLELASVFVQCTASNWWQTKQIKYSQRQWPGGGIPSKPSSLIAPCCLITTLISNCSALVL